ncbi:MAG: DUF1963 domain-containing protein [Maricaulaceae bacterium]
MKIFIGSILIISAALIYLAVYYVGKKNFKPNSDTKKGQASELGPDNRLKKTVDIDIIDAVKELLERDKSTAIMLYRPYPPSPPHKEESYLGGLPKLPPNVKWPEMKKTYDNVERTTSMHFLAQINLSEIKSSSDLPQQGALYFFADLSGPAYESNEGTTVIYSPNYSSDWPQRALPENISEHHSIWSVSTLGPQKAPFPRWPVRFFKQHSFKTEGYSDEFLHQRYNKYQPINDPDNIYHMQSFWEIHEAEILKRSQLPANVLTDIGAKTTDTSQWLTYIRKENELNIPKGDFPHFGGLMYEISTYILRTTTHTINSHARLAISWKISFESQMKQYEKRIANGEEGLRKPKYIQQKPLYGKESLEILKTQSENWQKISQEIGYKNELTAKQREDFITWLKNVGQMRGPKTKTKTHQGEKYSTLIFSNSDIQKSFLESLQTLFHKSIEDAELKDMIPDHYFSDLTAKNLYDRHLTISHQLLGNPPRRTNSIDIRQNDVLLLSLFSDYGVNFLFGDADQMQFYIDKDDLAARRFDKAWGRGG